MLGRRRTVKLGGVGPNDRVERIVVCYNFVGDVEIDGPHASCDWLFGGDRPEGAPFQDGGSNRKALEKAAARIGRRYPHAELIVAATMTRLWETVDAGEATPFRRDTSIGPSQYCGILHFKQRAARPRVGNRDLGSRMQLTYGNVNVRGLRLWPWFGRFRNEEIEESRKALAVRMADIDRKYGMS